MYKKASTLTTLILAMMLVVISAQAQDRRTAPNPSLDRGGNKDNITCLACDPPVPISEGRGEDDNSCSAADQCGAERNPGSVSSDNESFIEIVFAVIGYGLR
jgi:hypothetical protein